MRHAHPATFGRRRRPYLSPSKRRQRRAAIIAGCVALVFAALGLCVMGAMVALIDVGQLNAHGWDVYLGFMLAGFALTFGGVIVAAAAANDL